MYHIISDAIGPIPTEIGLLANMKSLDLSDNLLSGSNMSNRELLLIQV